MNNNAEDGLGNKGMTTASPPVIFFLPLAGGWCFDSFKIVVNDDGGTGYV